MFSQNVFKCSVFNGDICIFSAYCFSFMPSQPFVLFSFPIMASWSQLKAFCNDAKKSRNVTKHMEYLYTYGCGCLLNIVQCSYSSYNFPFPDLFDAVPLVYVSTFLVP